MAALALTRSILPGTLFAKPALSSALVAPSSLKAAWSIPTLESLLELLPGFLWAVPKKKTSHSRKAMRSANKGLKDKQNIVNCPGCGAAKLAHHLCETCYRSLHRGWKAEKKQGSGLSDMV